MIFIFEDNEYDDLSKLYRHCYGKHSIHKFIYAKGNGNLVKCAEIELNNNTGHICVFLDSTPGNKDILKIYYKLCKLSLDSNYRLYILPIVNAEHYFVKCIKSLGLVENDHNADICINCLPYFNSSIIETEDDIKFCRNFEKFCKLFLRKFKMTCISKDYSDSVIKNNFYNEDCKCFKPESICYDISLYIKSALLVSNYPLVPYHVELFNTVPLNSKQVWDLHCKLVDSFNETVDLYKEVDTDGCYGYMRKIDIH